MDRRSFTILAGSSVVASLVNPGIAFALRAKDYTDIVDRTAIIPSPLLFEVQTCRLIKDQIASVSKINVMEAVGADSSTVEAVRQRIAAALDKQLRDLVAESTKLRDGLRTLDAKQAAASVEFIKSTVSIVATGLITFLPITAPLKLYGSVLLTAYSAGNYTYQVLYKETSSLETVAFVTTSRNSAVVLGSRFARLHVPEAFEYYSTINELVMYSLSAAQFYREYRLRGDQRDKLINALDTTSRKAETLRGIVQKYLSNNYGFQSLLETCKQATINGLQAFATSLDGGSCQLKPTIEALEFFRQFDSRDYQD